MKDHADKVEIHTQHSKFRRSKHCTEMVIFKPEEKIGIIDLRLLGYYKIKQGILQQNVSKYYKSERAETLCEYFNKFVNTLKKEREQTEPGENYPLLYSNDERKYMTD